MLLRQFSRKFCKNAVDYLSAESFTSVESRDRLMKKLRELPQLKYHKKIPERKAAVLVPFCIHEDGHVSILYTLRSSQLASHAGHVSFPGGKVDSSDASHIDAALRETEEELGIDRKHVELWGDTNMTMPSKNFEMAVSPIIGVIKDFEKVPMKPNEFEVEEAFTVPLKVLTDPEHLIQQEFKNGYIIPVFTGGKHRIWGLTAVVTHLILSCMLPTRLYPKKFQYLKMPGS